MDGRIDVQPDGRAVARRVAEWLTERASSTPGRFAINLSGGSTPKTLYGLLAADPLRDRFPWDRTHVFFGDERFVPPDHPDSNYRMAREAMIAHVPIPATHVHAWDTSGDPEPRPAWVRPARFRAAAEPPPHASVPPSVRAQDPPPDGTAGQNAAR